MKTEDVLTVVVGVWLALFVRMLFFAALWNTKVWLELKLNVCVRCSKDDPEYKIKINNDVKSICESCARHDFNMTFEEAVRRGIVRLRKPAKVE